MGVTGGLKLFILLSAMCICFSVGLRNTSDIIDELRARHELSYPTFIRPNDLHGPPVIVNVSTYIINVDVIHEDEMAIQCTMYLRLQWNDPRLQYKDGPDKLIVPAELIMEHVWIPDIFISNARETFRHETLRTDAGLILKSNGDVMISLKLYVDTYCPMYLQRYPFDTQACMINIETYMYDASHLKLQWSGSQPVTIAPYGNSAIFTIENLITGDSTKTYTTKTYSALYFKFIMRREYGQYIVTIFIPSIMIVLLGWLIFWLPPDAITQISCYGAFLFLSQLIVVGQGKYKTPQVGYVKAMDVWTLCCFTFLSFAIFEVALVYIIGTIKGLYMKKTNQFELMTNEESPGTSDASTTQAPKTNEVPPIVGILNKVNLAFKIAYIAGFVLFNIIFWSLY